MKSWLKLILILVVSFVFFILTAVGSPCDATDSVGCYISQSVSWGLSLFLFTILIYFEFFFKKGLKKPEQKY